MDDRERQKLIEKLGAAKTSEERDRILRDLADQDRAAPGEPQGTEAADVGKSDAEKPLGKMKASLSPGRRSVVVAVMAIAGLFLVAPGMVKIIEGRPWGSAADEFFATGCALLIAAAIDVLNRKLLSERGRGQCPVDKEAAAETSGQAREPVAPGVRVIVLLAMASCGMLFIVDALATIMKGRYGGKEISVLIMGCAFLFGAIIVVLNSMLLAKMGSGRGSVNGGAAPGEAAEPMREQVVPEMRVAIIVLLVIAGLGSMVWSTQRIMSGRWDGGDAWILIQGCGLLYYAIFLILKGKRAWDEARPGDWD